MKKSREVLFFSLALIAVMVISACAPRSKPGSSNNNQGSDSNQTDATAAPAKSNASDNVADNFPLKPNPIAIQVKLDKANSVSDSNYSFPLSLKGKTSDGSEFSLTLDNKMYTTGADGNLTSAFGSKVSMTPITAIEGLPFSQGMLTAMQLGPDSLILAEPAILQLQFPGNVESENMVGFSANSDGSDFHLFPVTGSFSDFYNATQFNFNVMHFGIYGVAKLAAGEIDTQLAHPPVNPASQDENQLAPLIPVIYVDPNPLFNSLQQQLTKSYERLVKPLMDKLAATPCEQLTTTAYRFNEWRSKVDFASQADTFQQQIDSDGKTLHERFIACGNNFGKPGEKLDKAKIGPLINMATFAEDLSFQLGYDDFAYWRQLSAACANQAGIESPSGSTGGDSSGGDTLPTPTPVVCPL